MRIAFSNAGFALSAAKSSSCEWGMSSSFQIGTPLSCAHVQLPEGASSDPGKGASRNREYEAIKGKFTCPLTVNMKFPVRLTELLHRPASNWMGLFLTCALICF